MPTTTRRHIHYTKKDEWWFLFRYHCYEVFLRKA